MARVYKVSFGGKNSGKTATTDCENMHIITEWKDSNISRNFPKACETRHGVEF
jgi:hypothetical protein